MSKSALFTKLKGFGPLVVIGTAVVVTIKLLTTTTPTVDEDLSVDAKEDISLTQYEDTIELPPPPPEPEVPETQKEKEEEKKKDDEEEETEDEKEQEEGEDATQENQEEQTNEEQKSPEKKEEPKAGRAWNTKNEIANLLKGLLTPKGEK